MILSKAKVKNFRMLTDVEINFFSNDKKPLTVIRAQNESGKTTLLKALQWGLFGEKVLPNKGRDYRIHHINIEDGENVKIEVELEFTHHWTANPLTGRTISSDNSYILKRSVIEEVKENDRFSRNKEEVELFEITKEGYRPIPNPMDRLRLIMGSNLKDLFFTDGDDALRFIQDQGSKDHVKKAIKDMLSFDVIKEAQRHVRNCESTFRHDSQKHAGGKAKQFGNAIDEIEKKLVKNKEELEKLEEQKGNIESELIKLDRQIDELLKDGDKEALVKQKQGLSRAENEIEKSIVEAQNNISRIFYSENISVVLCRYKIEDTSDYLSQLKKKGVIPKASLPFLRELLEHENDCICGRPLKKGSSHYKKLKRMVHDQEKHSDLDDRVTQLRGISQSYLSPSNTPKGLMENLDEKVKLLMDKISDQGDLQAEIKELQSKIDGVQDSNLKDLRQKEKDYTQTNTTLASKTARFSYEINQLKDDLDYTKRLYENELKKEGKAKESLIRLHVANDIKTVLSNAYKAVEEKEIPKVSEKLNELFLKMIKSSEEHGLIQKALVNKEYEIEVFGPSRKKIKTNDLNGASQRALTLAFIMSLSKISEFIAPNVIDTPLGMMDDITKNSTIDVLVEECKQVVLFLTRAEIKDIENKLDKYVGSMFTMINSAHYPKKLVNENEPVFGTAIICSCSHREYCDLCEYHGDKSNKLFKKKDV